jgi:acyl-CoA dehydrogenase
MSAINLPRPSWMTEDLVLLEEQANRFVQAEYGPHLEKWHEAHMYPREVWTKAGQAGLLCAMIPEEYGGGGGSFAHEAVVLDELARNGVYFGTQVHTTVAHYILALASDEQKRGWLPRMARGELLGAIAMTEPHAGSDLQAIKTTARRDGDHYVINGSKTFITNGAHAGLVVVAAKTNTKVIGMRGISLIALETADLPGYRAGRPLEKLGMQGQATVEMFFDEVRVPAANLLGGVEGRGFAQMMEQLPYERLQIAVGAVAMAEQAVALTTQYVKERHAFGKPLFDLQNTRFKLAECKTAAQVGRVFLDNCIERFLAGRLDEPSIAMAKYWLTETQCRIVDECLQLHGGYGYMTEYPIARMWADSRVQRIYAGSNEIMKELIAWSL